MVVRNHLHGGAPCSGMLASGACEVTSLTCLPCILLVERRLLDAWVTQARRHGLRPHQFRTWIRRKTGPDLVVWRCRMDGSLGCATPCVLCQRELLRYDLRVHCSLGDSWFSGRLDDQDAPTCKPTTGQIRMFGQSPYCQRDRDAASDNQSKLEVEPRAVRKQEQGGNSSSGCGKGGAGGSRGRGASPRCGSSRDEYSPGSSPCRIVASNSPRRGRQGAGGNSGGGGGGCSSSSSGSIRSGSSNGRGNGSGRGSKKLHVAQGKGNRKQRSGYKR